MRDSGSCWISAKEFSMYLLLDLFKSKGMPVIGKLLPRLDPDYEYEQDVDPVTGDVIYQWRRKENKR